MVKAFIRLMTCSIPYQIDYFWLSAELKQEQKICSRNCPCSRGFRIWIACFNKVVKTINSILSCICIPYKHTQLTTKPNSIFLPVNQHTCRGKWNVKRFKEMMNKGTICLIISLQTKLFTLNVEPLKNWNTEPSHLSGQTEKNRQYSITAIT